MRKLFALIALAALIAGCGDSNDDPAPQAATPTAETKAGGEVHSLDLHAYSQGVKDYYGETHSHGEGGDGADVEAEYHQPPKPPEAGIGDTITLTGSNIGIRLEVTPTVVRKSGSRIAVPIDLENTGITVYEAPLQNAALTYPGGKTVQAIKDETCADGFDTEYLRLDVSDRDELCLLFPGGDGERPQRLQLALETVPTNAGGIWNLK